MNKLSPQLLLRYGWFGIIVTVCSALLAVFTVISFAVLNSPAAAVPIWLLVLVALCLTAVVLGLTMTELCRKELKRQILR